MNTFMNIINQPITTSWVQAGLIGVLVTFASIYPSINALKNNPSCDLYRLIKLEDKIIQMPIFYSILNIVVFYLANLILPKSLKKYWFIGIIFGLIYPTLGTIGDYAKKAYGIKDYSTLYTGAQIMYIIFYGLIMSTLMYYLC